MANPRSTGGLSGARILLTGASRGLGRDLAVELARRGGRLALVARDAVALDSVAAELPAGAAVFPADLADTGAIPDLVDRVEDDLGPVDLLVNNAAVSRLAPLAEHTAEQLATAIAVNLAAPAEFARTLLPRMAARGSGHLVNIASLGGVIAIPGLAAYGATKAGLAHLTAVLREEMRGTAVRVTLVQLGAIEGTDMYREVMRSPMVARVVERMGRAGLSMAEPADRVAAAIADGIERGRPSVVIPKVAAGFTMLRHSPIAIARFVGA